MSDQASPKCPIYRKVLEAPVRPTRTFLIVCDEGWRESIVCTGMYEWDADWLLKTLEGKPYAEETR